jgi:hypothetical protein
MALASVGARTPLFTSTFSKAVTLALPVDVTRLTLGLGLGFGLGLGLATAGLASALAVVAVFSFAVLASLVPAIAGTVMATTKRLNNHTFDFNIDGISFRSRIVSERGAQSCVFFRKYAMTGITHRRDLRQIVFLRKHTIL